MSKFNAEQFLTDLNLGLDTFSTVVDKFQNTGIAPPVFQGGQVVKSPDLAAQHDPWWKFTGGSTVNIFGVEVSRTVVMVVVGYLLLKKTSFGRKLLR